MNRRRRAKSRGLHPPTDHIIPAWLGTHEGDPRLISWRDLGQFAAAVATGYGLLWLGHTVVRFLFS